MAEQTVSSPEFVLSIENAIKEQAWSTWNQYRQYTSKEDLEQEGWVWTLAHPKEVERYKTFEKPKLAYYWYTTSLWRVMDKYARKERAQMLGYEPDDEAFYGKGVLEALLPSVLDGNPIQPQGERQEGKSNRDPAEGGTFLAMYLDVEKAWKKAKLSDQERDTLRLLYGEQWTQKEVADEYGIGQPRVSRVVKNAFDKMVNEIGGQYPPNE